MNKLIFGENKITLTLDKLSKDVDAFFCLHTRCKSQIIEKNKKLSSLNKKRFYANTIEQKDKITKEINELKQIRNFHENVYKNCKINVVKNIEASYKLWDKFYREEVFSRNKIVMKQLNDLKDLLHKEMTENNLKKIWDLYTQLDQVYKLHQLNLILDFLENYKNQLTAKQRTLFMKINKIMKQPFSSMSLTKANNLWLYLSILLNKEPTKNIYNELIKKL